MNIEKDTDGFMEFMDKFSKALAWIAIPGGCWIVFWAIYRILTV